MSSETEALPAGTTVYYCPLCGWTHAQLPPTEREIIEVADEPAVTVLRRRLAGVEAEVEAHLNTHPLLEWLTEVTRLRGEVDRLTKGVTLAECDAVLAVGILVRKLGGSVTITAEEAAYASGILMSYPEQNGRFVLAVTG